MAETVKWLDTPFTVYELKGDWNEVPGLYVFAGLVKGRLGTHQWHAYYIGQTEDFSVRLPTHESWPAAVQLGATHVHARVERKAVERERLEKELIRNYQPNLNVQHR